MMASQSEKTFGAKLRKAQDLLQHITNFTNYAPPRTEESVAEMTTLINDTATLNTAVTNAKQAYTQAVSNRSAAFNKGEDALSKRLTQIRNFAEALYGKSSTQYETIGKIINTLRASKLTKPPINPDESQQTTISQSQLSYGSQIQNFQRLIDTLTGFGDFAPSNTAIQLATLQAFSDSLTTMSDDVAAKIGVLRKAQEDRRGAYEVLKERVLRIKAYVRAEYGTKSSEYQLLKKVAL